MEGSSREEPDEPVQYVRNHGPAKPPDAANDQHRAKQRTDGVDPDNPDDYSSKRQNNRDSKHVSPPYARAAEVSMCGKVLGVRESGLVCLFCPFDPPYSGDTGLAWDSERF
jgi:hypothetical protein